MDFTQQFTTITEKLGNNENISVELNELMQAVNELQATSNNQSEEIETLKDYNNKLKEANTNLLLSKGFVSRSEPEKVVEDNKPKVITDFIKFN